MTIYEIAKKAGVSPATVSRVINGSARVSEDKKNRVEQVMEQENYSPNIFARGLNLNTIHNVGIICPVITDVNHAKAVSLLEHQLRENGFDTLLCCTDHRYENKVKYMNLLLNKRVDAILLIGLTVEESKRLKPFEDIAKRIPLIVINAFVESDNIYCVFCDERGCISDLVEQLYEEGYRRIMYLNDSKTLSALEKIKGFENGIAKCNLGELLMLEVDDSEDIIMPTSHAMDIFLKDNPPPDALIAADDILVLGASRALKRHNIDIPLIGFNNSRFSDCCQPEISSIDNNMETICSVAIQLLMDILADKKRASKVMITANLIERETYQSGAAKK